MNELSVFIGEEVGTELSVGPLSLHLFAVVVAADDPAQIAGEIDLPAAAIFGRAFHDALAGHIAAGAADGEKQGVLSEGEVGPLQGAQFAPAAASIQGEQIEHPVVPGLPRQGIQELLHLGLGRDALDAPLRSGAVPPCGQDSFQDLIPLGVAEDSGHHRQILLDGCLLDGLPVTGPLPQLFQ